jgi:hypothetical protein
MSAPALGSTSKAIKKPARIRYKAEPSLLYLLHACYFLAYSSAAKMEAKCYSETSADFQRTTPRGIPEDITLIVNSYDDVTLCVTN